MPSMRSLMELVMSDIERPKLSNDGPPRPPRPRRDGGDEPASGAYWVNDTTVVKVPTKVNAIVSAAGQHVMLHPEMFGMTEEEMTSILRSQSKSHDDYSPIREYEKYLANPTWDLSHFAAFHKSSRIMFRAMLQRGWMWVQYVPPQGIHLTAIPTVIKQQMRSVAKHFPILTIDQIIVTVVTNFDLLDRYPAQSGNRSLVFDKNQLGGFSGSFSAAVGWAEGKQEEPGSNYLYTYVPKIISGQQLQAKKMSVQTDDGRKQRWGIIFYAEKPKPSTDENILLGRVPLSAFHSINKRAHWKAGVTEPNARNTVTMYSDEHFTVPVEYFIDGKWTTV